MFGGRYRRFQGYITWLQTELHDAQFARGVKFSIKIGIGVGYVNVLYVGGMHGRCEAVTTGEALTQAFRCEAECGYVRVCCAHRSVLECFFRVSLQCWSGGDQCSYVERCQRKV
jgi:hypothetical protein